jgi:hypothetical protein
MPLVLHGYRYSVYVRIVRLSLHEKGVGYEHTPIDVFAAGADPKATLKNTTALMFAAGFGWRDGSPIAPSFDQGSLVSRLASSRTSR